MKPTQQFMEVIKAMPSFVVASIRAGGIREAVEREETVVHLRCLGFSKDDALKVVDEAARAGVRNWDDMRQMMTQSVQMDPTCGGGSELEGKTP